MRCHAKLSQHVCSKCIKTIWHCKVSMLRAITPLPNLWTALACCSPAALLYQKHCNGLIKCLITPAISEYEQIVFRFYPRIENNYYSISCLHNSRHFMIFSLTNLINISTTLIFPMTFGLIFKLCYCRPIHKTIMWKCVMTTRTWLKVLARTH